MREIKFRVWDKKLKEMNYLCLEDLCEDDYWYDGETSVWSVLNDCNNKNERFEIMQYTGLRDKNGVEIYEGDIIDISYDEAIIKNAVIEYHGASFYACTNSDMWELDNYFDIEVIGNIYEDLKEKGE